MTAPHTAIDLSNCDREPIHIPGAIQPHGALLAFSRDGLLANASMNAAELLGPLPALGQRLDETHLTASVRNAITEALGHVDAHDDLFGIEIGAQRFDIIFSESEGLLVVEFECFLKTDVPLDSFAMAAQRAIARLQRHDVINDLLHAVVDEIHALTGFDRVMAYRFLPDDSGEVVAERRRDDLEPFVGMRYPASDIPAQARRLYVLNPLRLIADIGYRPVPLLATMNPLTQSPFDMSRCVLRSVSPIHVEYLTNMGVSASMSISIVVNNRLWGMIACHHMSPYLVPRAVRMSCQLLSQILSVLVERTLSQQHASDIQKSADVRIRITERTTQTGDILHALAEQNPSFLDLIDCQGGAISIDGRIQCFGQAPDEATVAAWIAWLRQAGLPDIYATDSIVRDAPALNAAGQPVAGFLAACFHRELDGYVIWFRSELVERVRWGGNPAKVYTTGPLGARLTPRGSFAEWKEDVKGRSSAWLDSEREIAVQFRHDLQEIALAKSTLAERARDMLFATLGHDLRDPLQAIMMAAEMLERQNEAKGMPSQLGKRIATSSNRMKRLISEVLDISRIQNGMGLGIQKRPIEIAPLLRDLVKEISIAHPGLQFQLEADCAGMANVDPDRLSQVVTNLLSNARHHGDNSKPITVHAMEKDDHLHISIANHGTPIPPEAMATLFDPFKPASMRNNRNRSGLGLGLYIVSEIVKGHDGSIDVRCTDDRVIFDITLPR